MRCNPKKFGSGALGEPRRSLLARRQVDELVTVIDDPLNPVRPPARGLTCFKPVSASFEPDRNHCHFFPLSPAVPICGT